MTQTKQAMECEVKITETVNAADYSAWIVRDSDGSYHARISCDDAELASLTVHAINHGRYSGYEMHADLLGSTGVLITSKRGNELSASIAARDVIRWIANNSHGATPRGGVR